MGVLSRALPPPLRIPTLILISPVYEDGGINQRQGKIEHGHELKEGLSELEDVGLKHVRKVNQHMRRILPPAHNVEASCYYIDGLAPVMIVTRASKSAEKSNRW